LIDMISDLDTDFVLREAELLGASYADVRVNISLAETVVSENGELREFSSSVRRGVGVRVVVDGYQGYASTSRLDRESIKEVVRRAVEIARSIKGKGEVIEIPEAPTVEDKAVAVGKVNPFEVDPKDKVDLVTELSKLALDVEGVKSTLTRYGALRDYRLYASTSGSKIEVIVDLVGLGHMSVAGEAGQLERVSDSKSSVAGYEFIRSLNWEEFVLDISKLAAQVCRAEFPPAGTYTVILDPDVVGLLLHEAFGHASEGDLVEAGTSVLAGKLGDRVASEYVTIVDEGVVEGGYFIPYDDEGVRKEKTVVVDGGILKSYLTSRRIAAKLGLELTGNGRAQDYASAPIVRQTNYYMLPRDYTLEEIMEDVRRGLYVTGKGAMGGEVNPGAGTFTFSVGVSWRIKGGEKGEIVRGVTLSGNILDVLKSVDAVGRDLIIRTSVFGGCGKDGQTVKVGLGGPHVRVRKIVVGGR